jgi:threonine aldolase
MLQISNIAHRAVRFEFIVMFQKILLSRSINQRLIVVFNLKVMSHCYERGSEVVVGDLSHYNLWEQGGIGQIAQVYAKQIENLPDGTFDLSKLEKMIPDHSDPHCSQTRLVCIENTHNWCGGKILPTKFLDNLHEFCSSRNIKIHVDGSRIMNASVATRTSVKELCKHCDSINFCFSKSVGAPVGSILIGSRDFIQRAERVRKVLGGSMRQTGVLAAACLYGLEHAEENMKLDNQNAKNLAIGIEKATHGVVHVNSKDVQTNIVHMKILKPGLTVAEFITRLATVSLENKLIVLKITKKTSKLNHNHFNTI